MGILSVFPSVLEKAKENAEKALAGEPKGYVLRERIRGKADSRRFSGAGSGTDEKTEKAEGPEENLLALSDNLDFMVYLINEKGYRGKLNLVYLDPPFFSKADYGAEIKLNAKAGIKVPVMKQVAYRDTWEHGMEEYLTELATRLFLIRELLSDTGSVWVHLDYHATHYVRVLLDEIFGEKNFVNEIIWTYKSGGATKRSFAKKHDNLLFYAKGPKYYFKAQQEVSYNRGYKPYRFKGVKEYRDETGWYTMVNKKDVWAIDMVGRTSSERTGYATQKPETLMKTILESCTKEGDLVADFYAGSGTMPAACEEMNRRWICCDKGRLSFINTHKRMVTLGASYDVLETKDESESSREKGKVCADIRVEELPLTTKKKLIVRLSGYEPETLKNIPVEPEFLPTIRKVIQKDSLALVDFWSIEWKTEKSLINDESCNDSAPQVSFVREGKDLQLEYETLGDCFETVTIKVVDIFGNGGTISDVLLAK